MTPPRNGIIYWIGTNGKQCSDWTNPASVGLVYVSSNENLPFGRLKDVLSRDVNAVNCHTGDNKKCWISIDLGLWIVPSAYTLRHARGYEKSALRNWQFQVRKRPTMPRLSIGNQLELPTWKL